MSTLEDQMDPKYPDVQVQLSGEDGNAFFIIGRVRAALRRAGVESKECDEFSNEAMSGDYDNVLQTAMRWVSVA
jgi:hypothetical protein